MGALLPSSSHGLRLRPPVLPPRCPPLPERPSCWNTGRGFLVGQVDSRGGDDGHVQGRELGRSSVVFGRPPGGIGDVQVQQSERKHSCSICNIRFRAALAVKVDFCVQYY